MCDPAAQTLTAATLLVLQLLFQRRVTDLQVRRSAAMQTETRPKLAVFVTELHRIHGCVCAEYLEHYTFRKRDESLKDLNL